MNLKSLLEQKKCFKLICGAGNENLDEVEKLVALYSKAGCHFFDLAASEEVLSAAQRGLDFSIPKEDQKQYHFGISIGTKMDRHVQKAKIDAEKCKKCGVCVAVCPQNAINVNESRLGLPTQQYEVIEEYCIGCFRCKACCKFSAISGYSKNKSLEMLNNLLTNSPINLSCIELHASDVDEKEIDEIWDYLNGNFDGILSLCLGRAKLSNEQVLDRVRRLVSKREDFSTIIQADGSPMSGGEDDYNTTLQAVAMADLIQKAKLPVYTLLSGGTNSKTAQLAILCGVEINGIAVGSYARKIVKKYIERDDFLTNMAIFEEASKIARKLIDMLEM